MALSGSITGSIVSGKYALRIDWSATQSVANNTSKITAVMYLVQASSWGLDVASRNDNKTTIAGTGYTWTSPAIDNSGGKTTKLATVTSGNIAHNADGTKKVTISATFYVRATISGTYYTSITASAEVTLNTIPRATTPTVSSSSVNMGSAVTINTPRASSSFTHDLAYSFAGGSYVSIANGVGTSYSWTTPDLASKIPSATSGTVTIRCVTKNGSTTIGTKTVTMTLKVPTSVVPTISSVATVETVAGLALQFGAYIKGRSKIKATITAAGAKGSTIKSYSTTFNGKTYTGATWTSGAVTAAGSLSLVTTVTDTRGRTAKKTTTITVLDYSKPLINTLHAYRVNAEGAADPDGIYIAIRYKYSVTSLNNKNTAVMKVEYKRSTETDWAELLTAANLSADTTALPASPTFSTDYQFDIRLSLSDFFGAATPYITQLPSGAVILDIGAAGDCLGIGETAQHPGHVGIRWALKTTHGEIPRDALVIPAGANLDDYTTPGYYVFSSAASSTITGLQFTAGSGSVEVIREGDYNQVRQVVTRCSDVVREIWERLYYANAWHEWRCVHKSGTGRVLWSGGMYMTSGHTATLSEPVSKQPTGIVLVFSEFVDGEAADQSFHHRFISREVVAAHPGKAECIQLSTSNLAFFATKYLYIYDDRVVGHNNNNLTGTGACGITYTNNRFVLRYIIGV